MSMCRVVIFLHDSDLAVLKVKNEYIFIIIFLPVFQGSEAFSLNGYPIVRTRKGIAIQSQTDQGSPP